MVFLQICEIFEKCILAQVSEELLLINFFIQPVLAQCSISIPPANVRKPWIFRHFQEVWKWLVLH